MHPPLPWHMCNHAPPLLFLTVAYVAQAEMALRREHWVAPAAKYPPGTVLDKYSKLVRSASEGATLAK